MILDREVELARLAPAALLAVLLGRAADRHRLVRQVGHAAQEVFQLGQNLRRLDLRSIRNRFQAIAALEQLGDVLPFRFCLPDLLRCLVSRGLSVLRRRLQRFPSGFEFKVPVELEGAGAARGEPARHRLGVLAQ
ncbi:hypothetical protein D3C83_25830 [compost metagenome]